MKLDFGGRNMDVATFPFRFMRILGIAGTGGCDVHEAFLVLEKIRRNDDRTWVREWAAMAARLEQAAENSRNAGQTQDARQRVFSGGHVLAFTRG
jgi:hypothetical protein